MAESEDLLRRLQNETSELLAVDAFVMPRWFLEQTTWLEDPSNSNFAACNYPLLLRIHGPLNEGVLQRGLQEIVRRHEVFQSIFRMKDGELIQIVVPPARKPSFRVVNLSECPEPEREARTQQIALDEAHKPFDLARGHLLRTVLIRLGPDDHFLQLTTHDIVFDDLSAGILFRELCELYEGLTAGTAPALEEVAFQYGDYIRWHEKQLQGEKWESKLYFWKQQLSSPVGFHHLTADFPRPAKSSYRTMREQIVLPADLADSLKALARQERVSLFMVLVAGFQCLLQRYSNHKEIGIASCAANRPLLEVEGLIGRFGNEIFLRTSLSENPTFHELLARVRETTLSAYSDQSLPFGRLLKSIANTARSNRLPPFQVMFFAQNERDENRQVAGLTMSWAPLCSGTAKYDLNVCLRTKPALEVILDYSTDLFRATTMRQLLANYQAVLETMAKDPGARVSGVLISRNAQRGQEPAGNIVAKEKLAQKDNVAPINEVQSRLMDLWAAAFGIPVGVDENFFELGGDSLLATRLFVQIEKAFQMELPLAMLLEAPTIRQLAGIISAPIVHSLHSSLVAVQPNGTKPPLFCVHTQIGEIFLQCRNLSLFLGMDQPVFGLRSQGRGGETPYLTIEEMASYYLREIRTVQRKGPYFLLGYCFGGMIAYEMGRLLKTQGEEVGLLVMINTPAPGSLKSFPLRPSYVVKRIARQLGKLRTLRAREKLVIVRTKAIWLARLVSQSFKAALWDALAKSSSGMAEREAQSLLSIADINLLAAKAYDPGTYAGRIVFFQTEDSATDLYVADPVGGWMPLAEEGIEVHAFGGSNAPSLRHTPNIEWGEKLKSCLAQAQTLHAGIRSEAEGAHSPVLCRPT